WKRLRASPLYAIAERGLTGDAVGTQAVAIRSVLLHASTLYFGGRILSDGFRGDGVLAVETDEPELDPAAVFAAPFQKRPRRAPGVDVFELSKEKTRNAPVLVVVMK